ncbi:glycosyltransferase [Pontibacter lucknowensis]|uniref:Glycosyltransferase involved in cell wall bisynthesis n=1 Tax=Pontibacter lucknowensis TaxID=1077936 RepID=A0A1N7AZG2_9BACT|nr:glycosyltransferase [Pontibacter lucknowensis]SIR44475.1 Glycosyltransferase involved in cell wall bisynthesis [Pontibacter lucknowensis]
MRLGISIVICTYNGAKLLPETIRHIASQRISSHIKWEVLVVDNASTDKTSEVVLEEWEKQGQPTLLHLFHQPRQGLTYARELALSHANYEFVLFCDDDNWLCPDYLSLAYQLMIAHPEIGVLGGNGELVFESPPPEWAVGHGFFANGPQAKVPGPVSRQFVYGAGCVIRKSAYDTLLHAGFKPLLTDRMAGTLTAGGDYELCYAIAMAGYTIWYEDKLKFKHFMPAARLNWAYFIRFISEGARCFEVIMPYRIHVNMGSKNTFAFRLMCLRIVGSYLLKTLPLLAAKLYLPGDSEAAKLNTIKLVSLKTKLLSFKNYKNMKQNFETILKFNQEALQKKSIKQPVKVLIDMQTAG